MELIVRRKKMNLAEILESATNWESRHRTDKPHVKTYEGELNGCYVKYEVRARIGIYGDITAAEEVYIKKSAFDDWVMYLSTTSHTDDFIELAKRIKSLELDIAAQREASDKAVIDWFNKAGYEPDFSQEYK
jgi:hypothetical protein